MTAWQLLVTIILGLAINECSELSPWCARKLVRWSAHCRYADAARAEARAEELSALIGDRPGKLFKLITALCFAVAAVPVAARRAAARRSARPRERQAGLPVRSDGVPAVTRVELTREEVFALADAFPPGKSGASRVLLESAQFPALRIPETGYADALEFWSEINEQIAMGIMSDGRRALLDAARMLSPGDRRFTE
jgi:hypothetical protein